MSEGNFHRSYLLSVGKNGGSGFQVGNVGGASEVLHVSFSVEKSDSESANTAKVRIWNLSDRNLRVLDTKDAVLELKAGYGANMALILVGNVTYATTSPDGADRVTEIEVADGRVALRDTNISLSMNGAVNSKDLYEHVASRMGLSITFAKDLSFVTFPNGYSFVGKGRNALQKAADANGHKWSIQNGVIQVTLPGRPVNTRGYLLNSDSGLLSVPKRVLISQSGTNSDSLSGWEVECFLNGAIGVNDVVQLESRAASGYYRVHKVTMDGDNMVGDWVCVAQLLEIQAAAKLDKKAASA